MAGGKSKFLPNEIRRQIRKQLKRIALPLHSTRRYKTAAAARRHTQNIKNANLGRKHVSHLKQEKKVQDKIKSRKLHQKAAKEFHGQPNTIQVWGTDATLHSPFCAAQCQVIAEDIPGQVNTTKPGQIDKGALIMVRHCPGTKGPDRK
ncbi:hypothetical protein BD410DRAFT_808664 [Rickenella mellea]|uniref:Uncharacterized protein n=1 Tax=Rickenella mellea TaxID=50990 RepID=A0A4Y7PJW6_9AGAM|nr:hypothetical protein BD410DRAFT_808664 [Rickenella mellea]